jgi:hypothetical protein
MTQVNRLAIATTVSPKFNRSHNLFILLHIDFVHKFEKCMYIYNFVINKLILHCFLRVTCNLSQGLKFSHKIR